MMTVFVLAVLWLIVVVPMILRRSDERRRERSVDGFGRAMRALGRGNLTEVDEADARREVFVPQRRQGRPEPERRTQTAATPARRPVPTAQEALMYPVDRTDMSAARRKMMARRRRSLTFLFAGTALFGMLALIMGGMLWAIEVPFMLGLGGYLYFLRSQALRDRARRQNRLSRTTERHATVGKDLTEEPPAGFEEPPASMVRIDDDDLALHNMDTIDLTGVYEEELPQVASQRRAS